MCVLYGSVFSMVCVCVHMCEVVGHICGISVGWHVGSVYTCVCSPGLVLLPGPRRVL